MEGPIFFCGGSSLQIIDRSNFFKPVITLDRREIDKTATIMLIDLFKGLVILFRAFLAYHPSFQSYGGFK